MRDFREQAPLSARVGDLFDESILERGDAYYEQGRVGDLTADGAAVDAEVRGKNGTRYDVRAEMVDGELVELACDCPHAARLEACKHMWALVLAIDARGWGARFPGDDALDVVVRSENLKRTLEAVYRDGEDAAEPSGPPAAASTWRSPFDRVQSALSRWAGREEGVLPRTGACFLELHLRRDPFGASQLAFVVSWRRVKRDGSEGGFERGGANHRRLLTRRETRMLARLGGQSAFSSNSWASEIRVPRGDAGMRALAELTAWGGLGWVEEDDHQSKGNAPLLELRLDADIAFDGVLIVEPDPSGPGGLCVSVELQRGEERVSRADVIQVAEGLVVLADRIVRCDTSTTPWLVNLGSAVRVPADQVEEFFLELSATPDLPRLEIDPSLGVEVVVGSPTPRLSIESVGGSRTRELPVTFGLVYDETTAPLRFATAGSWDEEARRLTLRDHAIEQRLLERLGELGFRATAEEHQLTIAADRFEVATATLLDEDWDLRAANRPFRRGRSVSLAVSSKQDWFELTADVDFGGASATLPELLKAIHKGRRWVTLDDGSKGLMPADWLERYGAIARGRDDGDRVRYSRAQGALLDVGLRDIGGDSVIRRDEGLERLRKELATFERIRPRKGPRTFVGELRPYQQIGLGWLAFLDKLGFGGCLADDMGLGKTVQVLALLDGRRKEPHASLVVAPRSLLFNWASEAKRFAPKLRVLTYHGATRRKLLTELDDYDMVLTTYGTLRRDEESLGKHRFDYVVLDEAQAIKNPKSKVTKACLRLNSAHRLALTGTPIENSLGDLASLLEFLNPGMIDGVEAMNALALRQDPSHEERNLLSRALRPFILRRTKGEVLTELPDKTEQILRCELSTKERREYDELLDHYRNSLHDRIEQDGLGRTKFHVLEALLRLRQAACHPGLIDPTRAAEGSAKLDTLVDQLVEVVAAGHKALVFSQFTSLLAIVRQRLEREGIQYAYLDGSTRDRATVVNRFQNDEAYPVFLLSLKAGGTGLNLTAAGYVFLLDPWWNPAVEAQAIDRAHRIGQTRPVMAYRLVAKDTVEERILDLQAHKRELAEGILSADERGLAALDASDLEVLLS
jgi:superfamily II DNA or RNA helicase